jgi:DNA-binding CsgD family transcriptional regulator
MDDIRFLDRDWEFILDTVYSVNSTGTIPAFAQKALSCLCALVPCDQGTFFVLDEHSDTVRASETYVCGKKALFLDKFLRGGYGQDPIFGLMSMKLRPYAFRDTDIIPENVRLNSRVFREIYVPQGIHYAYRLELIHHEKLIGQFALFNSKERGDFSDRALRIGNLLAVHFAQKLDTLRNGSRGGLEQRCDSSRLSQEYQLTHREDQIIKLIIDGMTDNEVAERLNVSPSTVKKHVYNAYAKLGVNSRTQLIKLAFENQK